jgi:hypothetical protein
MIRSVHPNGTRLLVTCLVGLALAGCGSDGTASVALAPTPQRFVPAIRGTVCLPNGQLAAAGGWQQWADPFRLLSRAMAAQCLVYGTAPANAELTVNLYRVNLADAADGRIDYPDPVLPDPATDSRTHNGDYQVVTEAIDNVEECQGNARLLVAVGNAGTLTRAFVFSKTTNIDPVSEAVVQVVLDTIANSDVQLCPTGSKAVYFSGAALAKISQAALDAGRYASGETVSDKNRNAYALVSTNAAVKQALAEVTGIP